MSATQIDDDARGRRTRGRWYVHLGLLALLVAALVTLVYLSVTISIHGVVGLVFATVVIVHLLQRRRTITRLISPLVRAGSKFGRRTGLALYDLVLSFVLLNVLLSGVVDWIKGVPVQLPFRPPFNTWDKLSGIVLVVYLAFHIWHRRKRLRRSVIR